MKVVPLGDKLVVKRLESAEKTAGGILLPDGSRAPHEVNEGDRVVFSSYSGAEVTIDDEKLLILNADDVLAIVR